MSVAVDIADEARRYRALGWSIIPLDAKSKKPAGMWRRYFSERPRTREVQRWFRRGADRNVAVICGPISAGLCVRDFDVEAAYHDWAADYPDLADRLPTSRTARGYHVFLRTDDRDDSLPRKCVVKLPDGELRVRRCYVALPPSVHESGHRYEWIREPHHGVPLLFSVGESGLLLGVAELGSVRARARERAPCHYKPLQNHEECAPAPLFGSDGRLSANGFDQVLGWTLPTGPGVREAHLFRLARYLKSLPETRWMRVDELEPIVRHWWQMVLPVVDTKEWWETWAAFARAWGRARVPWTEGGGLMTDILDRARRAGCPAELRDQFGNDVCGLVAAICRELSIEAGGEQFYLCRDTLSRLCGLSHRRASACLHALQASRVIRRVCAAERGRATEFVYLRGR